MHIILYITCHLCPSDSPTLYSPSMGQKCWVRTANCNMRVCINRQGLDLWGPLCHRSGEQEHQPKVQTHLWWSSFGQGLDEQWRVYWLEKLETTDSWAHTVTHTQDRRWVQRCSCRLRQSVDINGLWRRKWGKSVCPKLLWNMAGYMTSKIALSLRVWRFSVLKD